MDRNLRNRSVGLTMSADFKVFHGKVAYLGPAGSWTHQACIDLFPLAEKVPLSRDEMVSASDEGRVDLICLPVTTSIVGVTPYMDLALSMKGMRVITEYPKMLGYSLIVKPGTKLEDLAEVYAHPVALEEVRPWLDRELPNVRRIDVATGGRAASLVAESSTADKGSFGPRIGADIYNLATLFDDIEEGPHNVTRWWVLGRVGPTPTGNDKTSMVVELGDGDFTPFMTSMFQANINVLTVYERPAKSALDRHFYLVEAEGHQDDAALRVFLQGNRQVEVRGSYPRQY
ncbi:prephenate dehydratase domain-containing protein [Rhizobium sp. SEMIA 4032]|uniref:prephenate dehydratase n=1 Tax=Rhizobium sp. SEMIA 4032 TaxID=2137762 RepID=UPI001AEC3025|nr:prephenate dehydratase domain-containing protein [Rhizobium sp. SEMIA 4032]